MFGTSQRLAAALAVPTVVLTGCYVIPVAPDGSPMYPAIAVGVPASALVVPAPIAGAPHAPAAAAHASAPAPAVTGSAPPAVLAARLYPSNDIAAQQGMVTGTVTNMMTGKGRFQMEYRGELLVGEATRVHGDDRRGVASAYGPRGTYMSCDYQMTTPYQGTGTCTLSNGAQFSVHLGG
jgi:hypothetical protein